jgi:hypothetical protein
MRLSSCPAQLSSKGEYFEGNVGTTHLGRCGEGVVDNIGGAGDNWLAGSSWVYRPSSKILLGLILKRI